MKFSSETLNKKYLGNFSKEPVTANFSIKLLLCMNLLQGYSEYFFFLLLILRYSNHKGYGLLNPPILVGVQDIISIITYLFWGFLSDRIDPVFLLMLLFTIWGILSSISILINFPLIFCFNIIINCAYNALLPLVFNIVGSNYNLSATSKLFSMINCYYKSGKFLGITVFIIIFINFKKEIQYLLIYFAFAIPGIFVSLMSGYYIYKIRRQVLINELNEEEDNIEVYENKDRYIRKIYKNSKFSIEWLIVGFIIFSGVLLKIILVLFNLYDFISFNIIEIQYGFLDKNDYKYQYNYMDNSLYYMFKCIVFIFGSAIGPIIFVYISDIIYKYIYNIHNDYNEIFDIEENYKMEESQIKFRIMIIIGFWFITVCLLLWIIEVNSSILNNIVYEKNISINIKSYIFKDIIWIICFGVITNSISEVILKPTILVLTNREYYGMISGIYFYISNFLSNPNIYNILLFLINYKHEFSIKIFKNIGLNMFPTVFHIPIMSIFNINTFNEIKKLEFPQNILGLKLESMIINLYTIGFYTIIIFIISIIMFSILELYKRIELKSEEKIFF
ncbi:uncharacterized protein CMU_007190 [Cryptosporidium muris RN66]|uniref:Major facilitator superfamily protein n=1 Tax=Cryptosporidium muris (strain RN66) TaxID=441375 RepID=B6ADD9_CRYMR|nr:uncharacterized protein CMU_007190 [Cryptosporidium muris RN66]EEA06230.1 hypothetical protein CMU_007190 [Cryptosporidium muris RN66]|eukprot:XP_002140579.1 hypothetical protein [Cryptosporidium muris RN66]